MAYCKFFSMSKAQHFILKNTHKTTRLGLNFHCGFTWTSGWEKNPLYKNVFKYKFSEVKGYAVVCTVHLALCLRGFNIFAWEPKINTTHDPACVAHFAEQDFLYFGIRM